jgi:hypothetical protein
LAPFLPFFFVGSSLNEIGIESPEKYKKRYRQDNLDEIYVYENKNLGEEVVEGIHGLHRRHTTRRTLE